MNNTPEHGKGRQAFTECRGTLRDKAVAWFNAEPEAKKVVAEKPYPRDNPAYVAGIIRAEEERYIALLDKAPKIVTKWFSRREITGESLVQLHHTHGLDPSAVEDVIGRDLTREQHTAYQEAWADHKRLGGQGKSCQARQRNCRPRS